MSAWRYSDRRQQQCILQLSRSFTSSRITLATSVSPTRSDSSTDTATGRIPTLLLSYTHCIQATGPRCRVAISTKTAGATLWPEERHSLPIDGVIQVRQQKIPTEDQMDPLARNGQAGTDPGTATIMPAPTMGHEAHCKRRAKEIDHHRHGLSFSIELHGKWCAGWHTKCHYLQHILPASRVYLRPFCFLYCLYPLSSHLSYCFALKSPYNQLHYSPCSTLR